MDAGFDAMELSQVEVDALLSKLSSEVVESSEEQPSEQRWKVVKPYDFRRPDKFAKDQMRTLQLIHESFGRLVSSSLSAHLRTAVQLNLVSIEQGVYGEYVESVPPDSILHILSMEPLPGSVLISTDLLAAMAAVDRLLGGSGNAPDSARTPTEIELALVQGLVANMLTGLTEAWGRVVDLQPAIRDVVLEPRYVQVALRSDPVVVIALEMSIMHHSGTVTICIPYVTLEPVLPKLTAQLWFASARRSNEPQHTDELRQSLATMDVDLMVELGGSWVTIQDMVDLKVGDVVVLDRKREQPVDLLIGGRKKYLAKPGVLGNKLAVQITGKVEELVLLEQIKRVAAANA